MITAQAWAGQRYAVLGLARSGVATVAALLASGADVVAWDSDPAKRIHPGEGRGSGAGGPMPGSGPFRGRLEFREFADLTGFDALVVSPGVPLNTHPLAAAAREAGVPVIGDIELFAQARAELPPHRVVGITGTNGKSTTTALVHYTLRTAGVPSLMGGNIGLPVLAQEPLTPNENGVGVYVLELSSYQIDLTQSLDCDVAVLLNITPDHLDRYDGFEGYAASKARLFAMQSADHHAVIAADDGETRRIAAHERQRRGQHPAWSVVHATDVTDQSRWPSLQGPHNAQNARAAIAVAEALGIERDVIDVALASFTGLSHRMERVAERNGVAFVDDSKATNPESTAPALGAFPRVHWIVGGRAKGDDLDACARYLPHVVRAYTIGEAGPRFAAILRTQVPVEEAGTLVRAVASAAAQAQPGDTVLLSPAAASFDQFADYEERGRAFAAAVRELQ